MKKETSKQEVSNSDTQEISKVNLIESERFSMMRFLSSVIAGVVASFITLLMLNFFNLEFYLSSYTNFSYREWLAIKSLLILILVLIIYYFVWLKWFKIQVQKESREKELFKSSKKNQIKAIFYILPIILVPLFYFWYQNDIWFKLNKFGVNEIGILVADFREPPLSNFPQGRLSLYVKEELPKTYVYCDGSKNVRYISSDVYFKSGSEVRDFGNKINAQLVIWGEVYKSDGALSVRPKLAPPNPLDMKIDEVKFSATQLIADYSEEWDLQKAIPDIDTLRMYVNTFLIFPNVIELNKRRADNQIFIEYLRCTLERENSLPKIYEGVFSLMLASLYLSTSNPDSSLVWSKFALKRFNEQGSEYERRDWLIARSYQSIAASFDSLGKVNQSLLHCKNAVNERIDFVIRPPIYKRLVCGQEQTYLLEKLNTLWQVQKDTATGDRLRDFYANFEIPFDFQFIAQYEKSFPGRLMSKGVGIIDCD